MPSMGKQKTFGRPHLLSLRNVAHSANDGTAVFFFLLTYPSQVTAIAVSR